MIDRTRKITPLLLICFVLAVVAGSVLKSRVAFSALWQPRLTTTIIKVESVGTVQAIGAEGPAKALVILAADKAHEAQRDALARALASGGSVAVTFDFDAYRASLAKEPSDNDCHYVSDDMKDIGGAVQRRLGLGTYLLPVVAGLGDGASFAYAALAQAPDNTLAGAISLGFEPVLKSDRSYCFDPKLESIGAGQFALTNSTPLPGSWTVIAGASRRNDVETFQRPLEAASFVVAEDEVAARDALVKAALEIGGRGEYGHGGLPVSVLKPRGPAQALAVIFSGDGGWRDIDKSIGEWLADRGVAVVGVDSLRYFWSERTPGQVAHDLDELLGHYGQEFGTTRYAVIGYSFGADMMPYVWPLLSKNAKEHVELISLLGLGLTSDFEITIEGFAGSASAKSRPLPPALARLPLARTQCIYGEDEIADHETSCLVPELTGAEQIQMKGGHHFDDDYNSVAQRIYARLNREVVP